MSLNVSGFREGENTLESWHKFWLDVDVGKKIHSSFGLHQYTAHYSRLVCSISPLWCTWGTKPRAIFHCCQPVQTHVENLSHPLVRKLKQKSHSFFFFFICSAKVTSNSLLITHLSFFFASLFVKKHETCSIRDHWFHDTF